MNRQSNFELLRFLAGIAVIILHFNYLPSGGGALEWQTGISYYVFLVLECICITAVNIFILITGYFNYDKTVIKVGRLTELYLQTIFVGVLIRIAESLICNSWNPKHIISAVIPVNYFVILYIAMMIMAPFINKLMDSLTAKNLNLFVFSIFAIFSVYSIGVDVLKEITHLDLSGLSSIGIEGSMNVYQIVNFIMVYIIGNWIRRNELISKIKVSTALICFIVCIILIMIWRHFYPSTAWSYNNPLVIIESVLLFCLFGKISFSSSFINHVAPASFFVFLINSNALLYILGKIDSSTNLFVVLLVSIFCIYLAAILINNVWKLITYLCKVSGFNKTVNIN